MTHPMFELAQMSHEHSKKETDEMTPMAPTDPGEEEKETIDNEKTPLAPKHEADTHTATPSGSENYKFRELFKSEDQSPFIQAIS